MSEKHTSEVENELIEGRNAVIEALRAGRAIDKIYLARGDVDKTLGHIDTPVMLLPPQWM